MNQMVKGICGAHRVHTHPSKEEKKVRGGEMLRGKRTIEDGLREFQL